MTRAIALAAAVRRRTAPNPWVGCVVVDADGQVAGEGATEPPGGPHAEALALREAGDRARGGTAYVTLEPCSHHGRTPPCAGALVEAGVSRVVVALTDPDPRVAGTGIATLRDAGIEVVEAGAPITERARHDLAPYLHQRATGRAFALLKTATSLDGRTAARDGSSQWITGPVARADGHRLRADSQAVVVGAGTALADRPTLTARDVEPRPERQPLRVLLDARGHVPGEGPLFDTELAPTLVVTTDRADASAVDAWRAAGAKVEVVRPAASGSGVDLAEALVLLGTSYGVLQAMVEGGAALHGALLAAGLADRIVQYLAPVVLGAEGRPAIAWPGPDTLDGAPRWDLVDTARFGDDVRLTFDARREAA
jgi:diaminohydroxyphosphoribosylaminopyrimidine deaminase/5-amino-6-(5-phosphoribosylamino)uracil reductase